MKTGCLQGMELCATYGERVLFPLYTLGGLDFATHLSQLQCPQCLEGSGIGGGSQGDECRKVMKTVGMGIAVGLAERGHSTCLKQASSK